MSREGLPPCVSMAKFEGRVVLYEAPCPNGDWHQVTWGTPDTWAAIGDAHPEFQYPRGGLVGHLYTDDETEAQAAYEKGAAWVLTGEGP